MSRIGKKPVVIPKGVEVQVDGTTVRVKGLPREQVWATGGVRMSGAVSWMVRVATLPRTVAAAF